MCQAEPHYMLIKQSLVGSSAGVVQTMLVSSSMHRSLTLCLQVAVCKEQVEWAITEKRTFLRQRIQLRLASLYLDTAEYQDSLKIVGA